MLKPKLLGKKGADPTDSDSVLTVFARNKRTFIIAYQSFAETFDIRWQPLKTSKFVFDPNLDVVRKNFCKQRNRIARTL